MKLKWVVKDLLQNQYELINAENGRSIAGIQGYYQGNGTYSYQGFFLDSDPCDESTPSSLDIQKAMYLTALMVKRKCAELLESIEEVIDFAKEG